MEKMISLQLTIFALILIGFFMKRKGMIGEEGQKNLNDLVIYVVLPCNIVKSFMQELSMEILMACLSTFLISAGIQVFAVIYSRIFFKNRDDGHRRCLTYGMICSNAGFLGSPMAEGVFGARGLLLSSLFLIPVRTMMWSEGIAIFSGTSDKKAVLKKVLTHPCIIACEIGLFLLITQISLPSPVVSIITSLGNCNTALCMLVIGMILAKIDPRSLFHKEVLEYCVHRLLIVPALVFAVCLVLPVDNVVRGVCVLLTAMPAGATTSILASKYDMEPEFATKMVVVSTLLSVITIFGWGLLVG